MSLLEEKTVQAVKTAKNAVVEDLKTNANTVLPKAFIASTVLIFFGAVLGATLGKRTNLHIYIHDKRR